MAKTMAQIQDSTVINMIWCSDREPQTETLIDPGDRPVGIGDTWDGENFYRGGEKILTPLEEAQAQITEYEAALAEIEAALGVST